MYVKCDINILFVLSLIILYTKYTKKGKMNKGVFNRTFVSYILQLCTVCAQRY